MVRKVDILRSTLVQLSQSDSSISYYDASMSLLPSQQVYRGSNQTKGVTMVPKRAMNVMSCEIVRLLQLTQNAIIPISYHVQRKSSDFHADLFPNTFGGTSAMTAEQWLQGANLQVELVSLDPMKKPAAASPSNLSESSCSSIKISEVDRRPANVELETNTSTNAVVVTTKNLNIVRSSKFRHIEGHFRERSSFINKFPSLSSTVPGDSNAFQINRKRVAAVLKGAGGQIGIFELSKTGRLDRSSVPTLQNTSTVLDFAFDPFDFCRIIVACEDAKLRLWTIPCEGLCDTLTDPKHLIGIALGGHQEKPNVVQFHPQAKSLMASAGYDRHLLVWDISKPSVAISLDDLSAPLFCMAWSPDGVQLATFAKDCVLSIFEPRSGSAPIKQGTVSMGSRGARLVWLGDTVIAISGFNRTSVRTVTLYDTSNLDVSISGIAANVSPAILVPYFDFDTKLLFLTGKGDSVVLAYEYVKDTAPYLFAVSSFNCGSPHQAVAFLPKVLCDVSKVEIATGLRLTSTTVEGFSICVPRTRTSYFQDDLYPDTLCVEDSPLTAQEWLSGENAVLALSSMKPLNLKPLSEAPKEPAAARKFASYNPHFKTDKEKKDELLSAMIDRMGDKEEEPLPQQDMDGAESDEWTE